MTTLTQRMNVVEENLQSIRLTLDTLLQNLLNPALMVPGTLRFGGNTMQLDQHGIQVAAPGESTSLTFVESLSPDPGAEPIGSAVQGRVDATNGITEVTLEAFNPSNSIASASAEVDSTQAVSYLSAASSAFANPSLVLAAQDATASYIRIHPYPVISGVQSPAQITGNQDDYAPTGIGEAGILRLTSDASRDITGITGGAVTLLPGGGLGGKILFIYNVGGFNIVLKNDVTSTAANRFLFPADITLAPNEGIGLMYDATSSRWRCFGRY